MGADVFMKVGTAEISGKPLLVESAHERGFYREQAGKRDIRPAFFLACLAALELESVRLEDI
jgi:hypothetical protein